MLQGMDLGHFLWCGKCKCSVISTVGQTYTDVDIPFIQLWVCHCFVCHSLSNILHRNILVIFCAAFVYFACLAIVCQFFLLESFIQYFSSLCVLQLPSCTCQDESVHKSASADKKCDTKVQNIVLLMVITVMSIIIICHNYYHKGHLSSLFLIQEELIVFCDN